MTVPQQQDRAIVCVACGKDASGEREGDYDFFRPVPSEGCPEGYVQDGDDEDAGCERILCVECAA